MPAMPEMTVAAAMAGFTPADKKPYENGAEELNQKRFNVPVDLYRAPVSAPAVILPNVSCFPRKASIEELTPL